VVVGEKFKTDGKIIIDPGWLAVYGKQAEGEGENDKAICAITPGETAKTEAIEVKENVTKPPPRYKRRHAAQRHGRCGQTRRRRGTPRSHGGTRPRHTRHPRADH